MGIILQEQQADRQTIASMRSAGTGPSRRVRAYAHTLVTTAIVLAFALCEWGAERFVSERSRAASTAIEAAIVLVAALVFNPVHKRVESAVEDAFNKRKRQALAALARFRSELTSFSSTSQLLRRVVEAVDHHMEARACAIYLRREVFRAEVSSFDAPADDVAPDDPLAVRLKSSAAPARPALLKSPAPGTDAFGMTAGGELIGFLCVQSKHGGYDAEESHMLAGLAQDLAVALLALDPLLQRRRGNVPNNLPAGLPPLIGREHELAELRAALSHSQLVTIAGPGGVGKTRIALQCAADAMDAREHGVWFVNLAPLADGELIAATMLAALDAGADGDLTRLIEYLRARDALIVVDNCEHLIRDVCAILAEIQARCPRITVLATSRELLHLKGEQVYRLSPLRTQAAVELFNERAKAASPAYDAGARAETVRSICERLDGIPLAVELAAARVRSLGPDEILERLHERFRLLKSGSHATAARQQTLSALIEWSYDLLSDGEQSLFRRIAVFRGSFSLQAASAVCGDREGCDEFHVLDELTSLADKSLLIATPALTTRYRMLETIREFASRKAAESNDAASSARRHAAYMGAVAAQAYHEFDSQLPEGWLDRLAPDIDNFREALEWQLAGPGDRQAGAQLAADCGPVFLRLDLPGEGLRWCEAALCVEQLPASTAGRLHYVASMMHNNRGEFRHALEAAKQAAAFYERSTDERGTVRALSQTAQLQARAGFYAEAKAPAAEAIRRARLLGEPRVLVGVLRRCASALPPAQIETSRRYFTEALDLARSTREPEEVCMVLDWWAHSEAAAGALEHALELGIQALACGESEPFASSLEIEISEWALALGRYDEARPHAIRALELARGSQIPLARTLALACYAPFHADSDVREAAQLYGYAAARLEELEWEMQSDDKLALDNALRVIESRLAPGELQPLLAEGAAWNEDRAMALVDTASTSPETSLRAAAR